MSRIGCVLVLGVVLVGASCADSTGLPDPQDLHQPLGAISGPGVAGVQLHPLRHRMRIVNDRGERLFHVVGQTSGGTPQLEGYELSFWAKRGVPSAVEVNYLANDDENTEKFLRLTVPADGLLLKPDGTPFSHGDSVLVSLSIDPSELLLDFAPSGLVFDEQAPAVLDVWYGGAEGDVPQAELGLWFQQQTGALWYPIVALHDTEQCWFKTHLFHFSGYAVSW